MDRWKYLKIYFDEKMGLVVTSPKETFRHLFATKIISREETEIFIKMVDDRNVTSYHYSEKISIGITERIPKYLELMKKLINIKFNQRVKGFDHG